MGKKKVPEIRFEGFTDEWEQCKLGEIVDVCSGRDYKHLSEGNIPVYGTGGYMLSVNKALSYDKDAIGIGRKGTIDKPYILRAPFWTVDTLFYALPKDYENIDFIYDIFQTIDWRKKDESTGVPSLSKEAINGIEIRVPSSREQKKIGAYFKQLDNLIILHQRKYEELKLFKEAMLDKMFSKNGEKVPEIRFRGFTHDWEQNRLGDIFEEYSKKNHPELSVLTIIQGGGTIKRDESDRNLSYDKSNLSGYKMVKKDDFIVHLRSFEGGLEKATCDGVISPAYHTFHSDNVDSRFYYSYFRSFEFIKKKLISHVYGIRDGRSIDIDGMKTIEIPYTSLEEQEKVGDYLDNLDHLTTLHQNKYEKLKLFKEAMLNKMLI